MNRRFRLIENIEINAVIHIKLNDDDIYNLKTIYYDFDDDKEMAVIEIVDDKTGESICVAVPKGKGFIID